MGRNRLSSPRGLGRLLIAGSLTGAAVLGLAGPLAAAPSENAAQHSEQHAADQGDAAPAEPKGNAYGLDRADDAGNAPAAKGQEKKNDEAVAPPLAPAPAPAKAQAAAPAAASNDKHVCSSKTVGNGGGANGSGAYGSTCDGSASQNGNGGGTAAGKPCAGCVGSADDKNPPGQRPNGTDRNAGYECDRNHGIGRGNPAHTACATKTTVPPTTVPPTTVPPKTVPPTTVPPTTVPPTTKPPKNPPKTSLPVIDAEVAGIDTARTPEVVAQAASPVTPADIPRGLLAMTGLPITLLVTLGTAAIGGGGIAVAIRRRLGK